MIDKLKATLLRQQGLSYAEIAKELNCSLDWCKRNLQDIQKNIKDKSIINDLVKQARTTEGLTASQIRKVLPTCDDLSLNQKEQSEQELKAMRRLKTKVKAQDNTVIRPYWMKPTEAKRALDLVLQAVNLMDQRLYEEVQSIVQELELDETYIKSLSRAITQMTYGGSTLVPSSCVDMCENLSKTADELEKRNTP